MSSTRWLANHRLREVLNPDKTTNFARAHSALWLSAALVALFSAGYAKLFLLCEHFVATVLAPRPEFVFVAAPLGFLVSRLTMEYFCPPAGGSGIPQVIAAIHLEKDGGEDHAKRLLPRRMIAAKVFGSCAALLGGGATGREGPTLQISASIFRWIDSLLPKDWPRVRRTHLLIAGSAAGLAAAFNAPLGGVVFAIEELGREHLNIFRSSLLQAVIVAGLGAQILLGSYFFLGHPTMPAFSAALLPPVFAVALACGLAAAFFTGTLLRLNRVLRSIPRRSSRLAFTVAGGFVFAALCWLCGPATLGSGKPMIEGLLGETSDPVSLTLLAGRLLGPIITYASGIIGGIFVPALAMGAALGSAAGTWLASSPHLLALAGMTSFLTAVTGSPFTSAVLVQEMTGASDQVLFLMLAAWTSHGVARLFRRLSFYETLARDYMPAREETPS